MNLPAPPDTADSNIQNAQAPRQPILPTQQRPIPQPRPDHLPQPPPPRTSSAQGSQPPLPIHSAAAQLATQNLLQQHHQLQQQQIHWQRIEQQQQIREQQQIFYQQQQQLYAQQQQQQQQYQPAPMNGVNGANMAAGGMPGPSPAGHQAELNYIYGMVEELSKQLADNRKATEDIVNGLGRVRARARTQGQNNDEVIVNAAADINGQEENLDALISLLSESLEKAKFSRDANASLLTQYAHAMTLMLRQFHEYKTKHVADVASWHRSYRAQLDDARRENSKLREQIWEMQAHAGQANESLRKFRGKYDEDEERWRNRVENKAARQELRFWKRMAMPELEDDDEFWSDDDDLIDAQEKIRLEEMERRAQQEQAGESPAEDDEMEPAGQGQLQQMDLMGGIAMQRDDGPPLAVPAPPPRPGSAASSTGSTGP